MGLDQEEAQWLDPKTTAAATGGLEGVKAEGGTPGTPDVAAEFSVKSYKGGCLPDDPNEAFTSLYTPGQIPTMAPSWKPIVNMNIPTHVISGKYRLQRTVSPSPKTEPSIGA